MVHITVTLIPTALGDATKFGLNPIPSNDTGPVLPILLSSFVLCVMIYEVICEMNVSSKLKYIFMTTK